MKAFTAHRPVKAAATNPGRARNPRLPASFARSRSLVIARSDLLVDGESPTSQGAWLKMMHRLKAAGVEMVSANHFQRLIDDGVPLVDVRTPAQFEEGFIDGATNVPLYQPITGWEPYQVARRFGYALFGIFNGTEPNPDFLEEVAEVAPEKEGVLLCCNLGGTLEPEPGKEAVGALGIQSRSLIAAYELLKVGYTDIKVLDEGVNGWRRAGMELWTTS